MIKSILVLEDGTEIMAGASQVNAIQSTSIEESCNDGQDLNFGSVCSKKISINIITPQNRLPIKAGEKITLYEEEDGVRRKSGIFNAEKPQKRNSNTTKIEAYDNISLLDKDVTEWFNSLDGFPYSAYDMAKMACEKCGLALSNQTITNGDYEIGKMELESVTARQIIRWIGEICGCFCVADSDGNIIYRWYAENETQIVATRQENAVTFLQGSLSYEDYNVKKVSAVQIIKGNEDSGISYPISAVDEHAYVIKSNPFLDSNNETILNIAKSLYEILENVSYTPCKVSVPCSFKFNVGDIITVKDANGVVFSSYVTTKRRKGQRETLESSGNYERNGAEVLYSTSYKASYGQNLKVQKELAKIELGLDKIDLTGYVTIESLTKDGSTIVDGSRIQTGQIVSQNFSEEYVALNTFLLQSLNPDLYYFRLDDSGYRYEFETTKIVPIGGKIILYTESNTIKTYDSHETIIETISAIYTNFGHSTSALDLGPSVFFSESGTKIDLENGEITSSQFAIKNDGTAYFGGRLEVDYGRIGAFNISLRGLTSYTDEYGASLYLMPNYVHFNSGRFDDDTDEYGVDFIAGGLFDSVRHRIIISNANQDSMEVTKEHAHLIGSWKATPYNDPSKEVSEIVTKQDLIDLGLIMV